MRTAEIAPEPSDYAVGPGDVEADPGNTKPTRLSGTTSSAQQPAEEQAAESHQKHESRWSASELLKSLRESMGLMDTTTSLMDTTTTPDSSVSPPPVSTPDTSVSPPPSSTSHPPSHNIDMAPFPSRPAVSSSPLQAAMPYITPGQLAFSAMQFLPVPLLVLSGLKTVVLANEAMGRLLGLTCETTEEEAAPLLDQLMGQSLSQVGVDMVQDGRPVWIDWEQFLDSLVAEADAAKSEPAATTSSNNNHKNRQSDGSVRPVDGGDHGQPPPPPNQHPGQSAVIEVIISRERKASPQSSLHVKTAASQHRAKMIVTVWEIDTRQTFFTLTFTNIDSDSAPTLYPISRKSIARTSLLETAEQRKSISGSNPPSASSAEELPSSPSEILSPSVALSSSPFPPLGPPVKKSLQSAPSILQKIIVMKDALVDTTETPILAMWRDGSVTFPNRAARKLFRPATDFDGPLDGLDLLPAWNVWDEDFASRLELSEFPISVLLRTGEPFSGRRIGMYDSDGNKRVFDALGEIIRDEVTGEMLAGVVTCRDVTKMTQMISRIKEEDEERFKLICDAMPQLVWTTRADGYHEFYNHRWYEYTGLAEEESLGDGWMKVIHPEDIPESAGLWRRSLRTGEPYMTEYRCRGREGQWKWFIGRALPLRSKDTGEIRNWFGTCTDANESIESRHEAKRTRQQLLSVIAHAHVTVFQVDTERRITMLEGALIEDAFGTQGLVERWYIGQNVYKVFGRLKSEEGMEETGRQRFLEPIETIITGRPTEDLQEHEIDGRFYRTRFLPVFGKSNKQDDLGEGQVEGVIGVIMDVSELKTKEADIEAQAREKQQLVASEAAAKEASKLKSQFLANMSHEIRTPITGVIGMAELLLDLELGDEQREYTENIYRSANALLTVINDILDFSKVESGRLDIEEVQFCLSVIVRDVNKMLSFAAERKNLDFSSDISPDIENDLVVMGDPGRVRQIITNLLTNSIKFTNQGYVKFSVLKEKETADTIEIRFVVEDTGIGIEEDVRKRLFQPFSQGDASTARKFGGTGLGLTICKSLLDLMHGRMTLESTLGSGTTATFWIPFNKSHNSDTDLVRIDPLSDRLTTDLSVSGNSSEYEPMLNPGASEMGGSGLLDGLQPKGSHRKNPSNATQSISTSSHNNDLSPAERAQLHVLVVEDNAINQQIATKTIQKLGFNVSAAWNGREALDYLTAAQEGRHPKPDIILMDVQMPVIDGYKCTHLLRHHLPYKTYVQDVPIVAMTASAIQGDREKCRKAGMDDYLAKPVRGKVLERMLVRWSGGARRVQPRLPNAKLSSQGSEMSDCSQAGEHCDNAGIPCVEHDDDDFADLRGAALEAMLPIEMQFGDDPLPQQQQQMTTSRRKPTPPPLTRSDTEETQVRKSAPRSDSTRETDSEMAAQSRDDKLFDAAEQKKNQGVREMPHSLQASGPRGEALTVKNMERHDKEEAFKLFRQ